jgi:hypothetical protein
MNNSNINDQLNYLKEEALKIEEKGISNLDNYSKDTELKIEVIKEEAKKELSLFSIATEQAKKDYEFLKNELENKVYSELTKIDKEQLKDLQYLQRKDNVDKFMLMVESKVNEISLKISNIEENQKLEKAERKENLENIKFIFDISEEIKKDIKINNNKIDINEEYKGILENYINTLEEKENKINKKVSISTTLNIINTIGLIVLIVKGFIL